MLLFKPVLKPKTDDVQYLVYEPRTFPAGVPDQAVPFARSQEADLNRPFIISDLVAEATKLSDLEKKNFQTRVQGEVLSRLKEIEEKAYAEAHALGLKEGQEKGFEEMKAEIKSQIESLKSLTESILTQKSRLVIDNERHLIDTVFHIARAIALDQIHVNPQNISAIVSQALENAQSEEAIVLRLNPADAAFIEKVRESVGNPFEKMTKLKVEPTESVASGGVIIETNYGLIDATIETRVNKVKEALFSKVPQPPKEKEKKS